MYVYLFWGVVSLVLWGLALQHYRDKALADPTDKKAASRARLIWLSFFLLPVYPALAIVAVVVTIIIDFRRLGRLDKENNE